VFNIHFTYTTQSVIHDKTSVTLPCTANHIPLHNLPALHTESMLNTPVLHISSVNFWPPQEIAGLQSQVILAKEAAQAARQEKRNVQKRLERDAATHDADTQVCSHSKW